MKKHKISRIVGDGLLMAIVAVATLAVRIPSPMGGYVNLGDVFVLLSGWILGPIHGALAAGVGSALADIISGCAYFAPGTLIVKGLDAAVAALCAVRLRKSFPKSKVFVYLASAVAGEIVMILGYFGYTALLLGRGLSAALSIPGNLVQAACACVISVLIQVTIASIGDFRDRIYVLNICPKEKESNIDE